MLHLPHSAKTHLHLLFYIAEGMTSLATAVIRRSVKQIAWMFPSVTCKILPHTKVVNYINTSMYDAAATVRAVMARQPIPEL